ncbi:hypothetical protein ACFVZR_33850 [Streptomyces sp. NPDC058316]|uniref:hypothetical protein n=1 Tax=unclassified Streptomyces TaxID=2593676 RepID=UPI003330BC35
MTLPHLIPNDPTDFEIALRMLAAHAIPGAEEVDIPSRTYTRLQNHAGGPARVKIAFAEDGVVANLPARHPAHRLPR